MRDDIEREEGMESVAERFDKKAVDQEVIDKVATEEYKYGFYTNIEEDRIPPGLNEDVIRVISAKKNEPEWLMEWRLKAFRHWQNMVEPDWQNFEYGPIDYQAMTYYAAPKSKADGPKSLDEVDPEILEMYEKLGIPLNERAALAGVAVDAVLDSVSVATTFKATLAEGHYLLLILRGRARAPGTCSQVSWLGCSGYRQLLCRP